MLWLSEVRKTNHVGNAQLWNHAVNILTYFTGVISPETSGPNASEELIRQRTPIAGFTPAIRLGLNDPEFAKALFEGAVDERENCDDENLVGRINWMKDFIHDAWIKNEASSSN